MMKKAVEVIQAQERRLILLEVVDAMMLTSFSGDEITVIHATRQGAYR